MKRFSLILLNFLYVVLLKAQISPPGLGDAKTASWFAIAARQDLNSSGTKQSVTYFGSGRKSNPTNENLLQKPAIFVINQEFYNQFRKNMQYSIALSYRRQHEYSEIFPFGPDQPRLRQEFRVYGRYSLIYKNSNLKVVNTVRQEYRRFVTPDFQSADEVFQLRTRLRAQVTVMLDKEKIHRLVASSEALFSISQFTGKKWNGYEYREARFCLYYSYHFKHRPIIVNIGYMNDLVAEHHAVHYLAADIILRNPFRVVKAMMRAPVEQME